MKSPEPLNGYAPNSQEKRVWSLAQTTLNVKVKDQRSRSPGTNFLSTETRWLQITTDSSRRDHSVAAGGDGSAQRRCVRFMFGKTSLALVFHLFHESSGSSQQIRHADQLPTSSYIQ